LLTIFCAAFGDDFIAGLQGCSVGGVPRGCFCPDGNPAMDWDGAGGAVATFGVLCPGTAD